MSYISFMFSKLRQILNFVEVLDMQLCFLSASIRSYRYDVTKVCSYYINVVTFHNAVDLQRKRRQETDVNISKATKMIR